jgi:DNA-binding winged helix-turn-helix (wHTH) protein
VLYQFGSCRLDTERCQLLRDGVERPLPPKALTLLRVLIDARPRVLGKAELMDLVWPDAYVSEANIAILIADLRAALGDSPRQPGLIKTHFGLGYSFCGEVVEHAMRRQVPLGAPQFLLEIGERRVTVLQGTSTLGRGADCDIVIPDQSVSRLHARLHVTGNVAEIEDVHSKNGTRVQGERIAERVVLAPNLILTFGNVPAVFRQVDRDEASTLTT